MCTDWPGYMFLLSEWAQSKMQHSCITFHRENVLVLTLKSFVALGEYGFFQRANQESAFSSPLARATHPKEKLIVSSISVQAARGGSIDLLLPHPRSLAFSWEESNQLTLPLVHGRTSPTCGEGMALSEWLDEERQLCNCQKVGSDRFTNALGYVAERGATSGKVADPARRGDLPRGALHYVYL
jgi:hypothetical protein